MFNKYFLSRGIEHGAQLGKQNVRKQLLLNNNHYLLFLNITIAIFTVKLYGGMYFVLCMYVLWHYLFYLC